MAFASYATLDSGLVSDQIKALEAADFSTKQAEEFATRYTEVITQFNDTETSLSSQGVSSQGVRVVDIPCQGEFKFQVHHLRWYIQLTSATKF